MQSQIKNKLILFVFLFFQIVIAQEYTSKNISTLDGLPSNEIFSIFKDSRGILWVGTGNGLSKITNGEIKNYYKSDGLAHNSCWSIVEDQNKNMWFASYGGGLTFYDGKKFVVYNSDNGLTHNQIRKLFLFGAKLFVGTEDGLNVIDINTKKIENYKPKSKNEKFQIMDFFEHKGVVYVQNFREGLWKFDKKNKTLTPFETNFYSNVFTFLKHNDELIYTYDGNWTKKGINRIKIDSLLNKGNPFFEEGRTVIFNLSKGSKDKVYAAGVSVNQPTGGLFEYNLKNNQIKNVGLDYGINSKNVWSLFYDKINNQLYVGTLDFGLYTLKLDNPIQFYSNEIDFENKNPIIDFDVYQNKKIILKSNELIIEDSISKQVVSKEQYLKFSKELISNNKRFTAISELNVGWSNEIVFKTFEIYNDLIWIKVTNGLVAVNLKGDLVQFLPYHIGKFDFIDENTLIFQKPFSKIFKFKNVKGLLEYEDFNLIDKNNPRDVIYILKNENNHYFISYSRGIFTYKNNLFYSFFENNIWDQKEFKHAVLDSKNRLVVSNSIGDIYTLSNSKDFKIESEIKTSQYEGNTIQFLNSYKEYLIIATEKGINLYKDGSIILLDKNDGINELAISGKVLKDILYIATKEGIYEIDLKEILKTKKTDFKVVITNLEINYKNILEDKFQFGIFKNNAIELPYNQNIVNIKYEIANHPEPKKLNYSYKVNGLQNSEWTEWNSNNTINLPYLPNGNFEILVKIKDLANGKTYSYQLLKITINAPFWKTWWFIAISIVVLGLIVYLIYRRRIKELKEKNRIQKRLVETKMEALQSQMNPHFIFNAMNSIQNFIIDNNTDDALMYMGEFSKIIRQTLNNSSLQKITLFEDLQYIQSYITIENMRYKNKINVEVNIDDSIDLMELEIPPMLIQPFIENVFVHAFDSTISDPKLIINYKLIKESLIIEIIDNGKGLNVTNKNRLNNSKGIKLTKERISLLNPEQSNSIEIKSTHENGTIVRIDFNTNVNFQKHYDN